MMAKSDRDYEMDGFPTQSTGWEKKVDPHRHMVDARTFGYYQTVFAVCFTKFCLADASTSTRLIKSALAASNNGGDPTAGELYFRYTVTFCN